MWYVFIYIFKKGPLLQIVSPRPWESAELLSAGRFLVLWPPLWFAPAQIPPQVPLPFP